MTPTQLADATAHARSVLTQGLDPALTYHSLHHTADEVVPAVRLLARGEGVEEEEEGLLVIAAWFHDVGYTVQAEGHERIGASMAQEVLPTFGFDAAQIDLVTGMIMATQMPQTPDTHLEQIICDADMCNLGKPTYWDRSDALRQEWAATGGPVMNDAEWTLGQVAFLSAHTYFTRTARELWGDQKARHLIQLRGG